MTQLLRIMANLDAARRGRVRPSSASWAMELVSRPLPDDDGLETPAA